MDTSAWDWCVLVHSQECVYTACTQLSENVYAHALNMCVLSCTCVHVFCVLSSEKGFPGPQGERSLQGISLPPHSTPVFLVPVLYFSFVNFWVPYTLPVLGEALRDLRPSPLAWNVPPTIRTSPQEPPD